MEEKDFKALFTDQALQDIFPRQRADQFFEALYGDFEEGAYTIGLKFQRYDPAQKTLFFDLELEERPGKCLACNLTYGLPEVFSRHPIIDIKGVVKEIKKLLGDGVRCQEWTLGRTQPVSKNLHTIPLRVRLEIQ
ncbi:MAG: pancreas/duodenum homeobox protein 1 [Deltaproteobacteria bacterium]|nr:pancreas/duodenum homeobox protein 1 [Deltaproteobacteria bacterium]